MSNKTTTNETEWKDRESAVLSNLWQTMETGTNVLQRGSTHPRYPINSATGNVPKGIAAYVIAQGQYEQNKKSTGFVTHDQGENGINGTRYQPAPGTKAVGYILVQQDKVDEQGKTVLNEKGKPVKQDKMIFVFASEDMKEFKMLPKRDENGKEIRYAEDVVEKAKQNRTYTDKDGNVVTIKAGDDVVVHKAGSIEYERKFVENGKQLSPSVYSNLPPLTSEKNLAELPKVKDQNDLLDVVKCELAKGLRGLYYGTGDKCELSREQIKQCKEAFSTNANIGIMQKMFSQADTYARGNAAEIKQMEENVNRVRQEKAKSKENSNTQENVKEEKKSKGRKA